MMHKAHTQAIKFILLIGAAALVGCQSYWDRDPQFGSSVNDAVKAQAVNPNAPQVNASRPKQGMDGVAAKKSIDNYDKSFDAKTPGTTGTSLISINNGLTGSNR